MIMILVSDCMNEWKEDLELLEYQLEEIGVKLNTKAVKHEEYVHVALEKNFDILFFDYGGMAMPGNSMVEMLCKDLIEHAKEHPDRYYIMASRITGWAMKEVLLNNSLDDMPKNIIFDIYESEKQKEMIREIFKKRGKP